MRYPIKQAEIYRLFNLVQAIKRRLPFFWDINLTLLYYELLYYARNIRPHAHFRQE
jgi:hypothetical protein